MIPGLLLTPHFLSPEEHTTLLDAVDAAPWRGDLARRVQHYGYVYDYRARRVGPEARLGPLPPWAEGLAARLVAAGVFPAAPDQLIVNEYLPGQGIAPHIDCVPCFGPVVASLTLGAGCAMVFDSVGQAPVTVRLEVGALAALTGEARYLWRHSIPARRSDVWGGIKHPRGRRVSLTFRTVTRAAT